MKKAAFPNVLFFLIAWPSGALGADYQVGDAVDVVQNEKFFNAKIEKKLECISLKFADDEEAVRPPELIAPLGEGRSGAGKQEDLSVGVEVDSRKADTTWQMASVTGKALCYWVSYDGWTKPNYNEWVTQGRVFAAGSKAKGDTGEAAFSRAISEKQKAALKAHQAREAELAKSRPKPGTFGPTGDYTNKAGIYFTAQQISECRALGRNESACRGRSVCTWKAIERICGINDSAN